MFRSAPAKQQLRTGRDRPGEPRRLARKGITRVAYAATAAGIALAGTGLAGAAAAPAIAAPRAGKVVAWQGTAASAVPGTRLWASRYNGPGNGFDQATAVAASSRGGGVFVTGYASGAGSGFDYATIAYNGATGARLWIKRYNGPANGYDQADAVAVSPNGQTVFVTGHSQGTVSVGIATIAYNAATGAQLWVSRYGNSAPTSLTVSPDGRTVFVTGTGYTTVAFDAATGARLWARHYPGGAAWSEAVSPDGSMVFVTGNSQGTTSNDFATIAYSAATGKQLWVSRYDGPVHGEDFAFAVAASPDGKMVLVSGASGGGASGASDFATIAYDAATGAQLWLTRYNSPGDGDDQVHAMAVSPDGKAVFVTGTGGRGRKPNDYTTIAYRTATGAQLWLRRYSVSGNLEAIAHSVVVSPSGGTVYVTGDSLGGKTSDDYATLAYRAATGAQLWVQRYNGPANRADAAVAAAVSPTMNSLFVTGLSQGQASNADYLTIAYRR
jgi:hypothetical protein